MVVYLSIGKNSDDTFPLSRLPFPVIFLMTVYRQKSLLFTIRSVNRCKLYIALNANYDS